MIIGIIGLGWVGSSVAISTLHGGVVNELLLNDTRLELAEGEALDLAQGAPFYPLARVRTSDVSGMRDCDAVVIAAGRGGTPSESRLDLLADNVSIVRSIATELAACRGVVIVVTNPVDLMTRVAYEASGLPESRVIGTGTMLDTARLRHVLGRELDIAPRSIHANVVGEHGDSEVVLWSGAQVGGRALRDWPGWGHEREIAVADEVRFAAREIIARKGATNHAIGLVTAALMRWILRGERRVLTVSRVQRGAFGLSDVALSLPTIIGAGGAVEVIEPAVSKNERTTIARSAAVLQRAFASISA